MNDGEQEKELHNPSHEECDHDDDDLYDDEFDEDLALEEVWVWHDDHDDGVPHDGDLYGEALDVHHSYDGKEEVQ